MTDNKNVRREVEKEWQYHLLQKGKNSVSLSEQMDKGVVSRNWEKFEW